MYFLKVPVYHHYTNQQIVYQVYLIIKIVYGCQLACIFQHNQNCPWWHISSFLYFFFKGLLPLYNKDFLQYFITHKSFSGISMYCWVNRIVLSNISSDIDRQNSAISNWINLHWFIFNKTKPFNYTFRIPPLVYLEKFY